MTGDRKETPQAEESSISWRDKIRSGLKNVTVFAAAATSVSAGLVGTIKLASMLTNALLITLPKYWTYSPSYTEEDVSYYTFLAMIPFLFWNGGRTLGVYFQNYQALTQVPESPAVISRTEKIGEHATALVKSLKNSANLPVLYATICAQLVKKTINKIH